MKLAGHSEEEIFGMSLAKLKGYIAAAQKRRMMDSIEYMTSTAVATQGDKKSITRATKNIQHMMRNIKN